MPNMPEFTIGMINARDRVFSVVDLGQVFGLEPLPFHIHNYQVIIINTEDINKESVEQENSKFLGLAVHRLGGVTRFNQGNLKPVTRQIPKCLEPYHLGCFEVDKEEVLVLDALEIANITWLHNNSHI
jgi:chemotaxis signal transduction protein